MTRKAQGGGIVLAPEQAKTREGFRVEVRVDPDIDFTPLDQRQYARYLVLTSRGTVPDDDEHFELTLHPASADVDVTVPTYTSCDVSLSRRVPGVTLYGTFGAGSLGNGWPTSLDRLEEFAAAILALVREARSREVAR